MQRRPEIEEEMFTCLLPISDGVVKLDKLVYQTCITGFRRLLRLPNVVHFPLCQETNQNLHPPEEFPSEK